MSLSHRGINGQQAAPNIASDLEGRRPFTVARLADHWGTSETFVYDQIRAGRLKAMRFGGKLIRIKPEAVDEYEREAERRD